MSQVHFCIHVDWIAEIPNHGRSAILNEEALKKNYPEFPCSPISSYPVAHILNRVVRYIQGVAGSMLASCRCSCKPNQVVWISTSVTSFSSDTATVAILCTYRPSSHADSLQSCLSWSNQLALGLPQQGLQLPELPPLRRYSGAEQRQ